MDEETFLWYEANASSYSLSVKDSLVEDALSEFLSRIPGKSRILDLGCGCGRDSAYFISLGHEVDSIDISPAMAGEAKRLFDVDVVVSDMLSLDKKEVYQGVWAQASLLHLSDKELSSALVSVERALKEGGILYASFRLGDKDTREEGRRYTNMTEERLLTLLPPRLEIEKVWAGKDVRKAMGHRWLSAILRKRSAPGPAE